MHSPKQAFEPRKAFLRNSTLELNNFHEDTLKTKRNPYLLQLNFNKNFNYMEPWIFPVTLILNFVLSIKGIKVNFFTNELRGTQIKMKE